MSVHPSLQVERIGVSYGGVTAVASEDLSVEAGTCVAVIGANGAGKSSLLRGIGGLTRTRRSTRVLIDGVDLSRQSAARRARQGLGHVLQGRHLFPGMTVRENIELAASLGAGQRADGMAVVERLLPELSDLMDRHAETLSGGQQQFAAIGRSLAAMPKVLMLDEPTNGLAPRFVDRVVEVLRALRDEGIALLLVEQRLEVARRASTTVCVFSHGRIIARTTADDAELAEVAHRAYLS